MHTESVGGREVHTGGGGRVTGGVDGRDLPTFHQEDATPDARPCICDQCWWSQRSDGSDLRR